MNNFIARYKDSISGVLCGFDRLVLRGNLSLNYESGMKGYLWANQIAWKDYAQHVEQVSQRVKRASLAVMEASHRPVRYLSSGKLSKEELARSIAREHGVTTGPVCAFTAVEPCWSWRVTGSIKLYDKLYAEGGAVLRPELTLNAPGQFRVFRHAAGETEDAPRKWRSMRAGIADFHRRAEVSQKALDRYCTALVRVDDTTTLRELTESIEKRVVWNGQKVRAVHPFDPADLAVLRAVNRGEFTINGLRNRDLQALLYAAPPADKKEARKRSAAISRKLRLLRAHSIIQKLPHTHRYQVTDRGRMILNAVLSAERTTTQQLTAWAA